MIGSVISRPPQKAFLNIPQSPLCYWLRPRFFELLAGKTLGDVADVVQGLATANDPRFVRFVWEAPPEQYGLPVRSRRWVPFEKGGGYGKWYGHHWWVVDWSIAGTRIKQNVIERYPYLRGKYEWVVKNEQYYFREGWTYTQVARGSIGVRRLSGDQIFGHASNSIFHDTVGDAQILNSHVATFLVRAVAQKISFEAGHVQMLPIVQLKRTNIEEMLSIVKHRLVSRDATERSFQPKHLSSRRYSPEAELIASVLHTIEGYSEAKVFGAYGLSAGDTTAVLDETGSPTGWFPFVTGFDQMPPVPEGLPDVPESVIEHLSHHDRVTLSDKELADIRSRLRSLYQAGFGTSSEEQKSGEDEDGEEQEQIAVGALIPIPAETFLEELSLSLELHPISVYWLLKAGIEQEGWRCLPEERRVESERITVMILHLLGHQWPTQIEAGDALPDWADVDGIIPLTGGSGKPTLLGRLRERIAADYDGDVSGSFERHFAEVMGKSLELWLETEFFKYQISLLRKRPIAWQIQSGRYVKKHKPAFACLLYYHNLDDDLLPKLRAQYVGPLRQKWETELRSIEEVPDRSRSDRQDARRVELEEMITELKDFDERLKEVMDKGFASAKLKELVDSERPDKWCSIDGELPPPSDRDALLVQEGRYLPDINDGVRVNIAPLQKAGLLAAEVIAKKDVETAITDRAEWRSDERRWCREGKLPHPGWWQKGAADGSG